MKKFLVVAAVATGFAILGANQPAQADHQCGNGGGYAYAAPVYSYAVPQYSYAPVYRSVYVQPSYGYGIGYNSGYGGGLSIGFGRSYYGGHGGHYGGGHHGGGHH
jgi:hypothetical protein